MDEIYIPLWFPLLTAPLSGTLRETKGKRNLWPKLSHNPDAISLFWQKPLGYLINHTTGRVETGLSQLKAEQMKGFSEPSPFTGSESEMFSDMTQSVKRQIRDEWYSITEMKNDND